MPNAYAKARSTVYPPVGGATHAISDGRLEDFRPSNFSIVAMSGACDYVRRLELLVQTSRELP